MLPRFPAEADPPGGRMADSVMADSGAALCLATSMIVSTRSETNRSLDRISLCSGRKLNENRKTTTLDAVLVFRKIVFIKP